MQLVDTILQRRSQPIVEGEIGRELLQTVFRCALTAPDHKRLRPWRFIVCDPAHKPALQQLVLSSLPATADDDGQARQVARKLAFAPHIVICALEINRRSGVPEIEQILSSGAAIQNMIVAAEALGLHCCWKTGAWAYNPALREKLGLSRDAVITGFLGLGRRPGADCAAKPVERPAPEAHFISLGALVPRAESCLCVH